MYISLSYMCSRCMHSRAFTKLIPGGSTFVRLREGVNVNTTDAKPVL